MNRPLPLRDRPRSDEGGYAYLRRIAHINGYRGASDLFKSALPDRQRTLGQIAELAGIEAVCLQGLPGPWPAWIDGKPPESTSAKSCWFNRKRVRWCPSCLREDHYVRSAWSLKLLVACPRHALLLRESCDACGATYPWNHAPFKTCSCGRALADMHSNVADDAIVEMMRWCQLSLSRASGCQSIPYSPLSELSADKMLLLLHCLAPLTVGLEQCKTGIVPDLHDLGRATRYIQECARILAEWPNGFRATVTRYAEATPATTSIRRTFGSLYRVLYRELADSAFDFLRREFEVYLNDHWRGVIDGRHRTFSPLRRLHDAVSGKEIREQLSCSRATVQRLLANGTLSGTVLHSPTGRAFVVSDHTSVRRAKEKLNNIVDLRAGSRELGISRPRMRLLLDTGLVRSSARPGESGPRWAIPRAEIDRWLALPVLAACELDERSGITLAHLFKHRCSTNAAFLAVAQALIDGTIRCIGRHADGHGISSLLVRREDADSLIASVEQLPVGSMTATDAGTELGVKEEVVYQLMRTGLLGFMEYRINHRVARLITGENLHDFRSRYVTLVNAAKRWNVSPGTALKRLKADGCQPVSGPSVDGSRQYFFRAGDIRELSFVPLIVGLTPAVLMSETTGPSDA